MQPIPGTITDPNVTRQLFGNSSHRLSFTDTELEALRWLLSTSLVRELWLHSHPALRSAAEKIEAIFRFCSTPPTPR